MLKFIEPMLSEHISGLACSGAARRSSSDIPSPPPVVMLTTASVLCLITGRNCMKTAGSGVGRPSLGSRACRCRMAAPASAAAMDCSAICCGVMGRCSDMEGVWIAPVTAQLMMTLVMARSLRSSCAEVAPAGARRPGGAGARARPGHPSEQALDPDRQLPHPLAGGVEHGVGDRRIGPDIAELAQALDAERRRLVLLLQHDHVHLPHVGVHRDQVFRDVVVDV